MNSTCNVAGTYAWLGGALGSRQHSLVPQDRHVAPSKCQCRRPLGWDQQSNPWGLGPWIRLQKVHTYSSLCIFHLMWPNLTHPIWWHTMTLAWMGNQHPLPHFVAPLWLELHQCKIYSNSNMVVNIIRSIATIIKKLKKKKKLWFGRSHIGKYSHEIKRDICQLVLGSIRWNYGDKVWQTV